MAMDVIDSLGKLLKETETMDFPFMASYEKKLNILDQKKNEIDHRIREIIDDSGSYIADNICTDYQWNSSIDEARQQFEGMDDKRLLNGFFLQEVMHRYVEKNIEAVKGKK